jgi:hypothetical protein
VDETSDVWSIEVFIPKAGFKLSGGGGAIGHG